MGKKIVINIVIILILVISRAEAQRPNLKFERLTDKNGRSLGFTTGITQDKFGFIWISTRSGLYRYDGYNYKLFRNNPNDSTSLPYRNFTSLYYDNNGVIWLKHFNQFAAFENEKRSVNYKKITEKEFDFETKIVQDRHGNYWVGPTEQGLFLFENGNNEEKIFTKPNPEYHPNCYALIDSLISNGDIIVGLQNIENKKDTIIDFSIHKKSEYFVVSVGESSNFKNYDFGSIYSGKKLIWEMSPEKAKFAGGAEKNKIQIDILRLNKGSYKLRFKTDNSNAYNGWKAGDAPDKTSLYGIVLIKIPEKEKRKIKELINKLYLPENAIMSNDFKDLSLDAEGNFFIATPKGLDIYNHEKGVFDHHAINFKEIFNLYTERQFVVQEAYRDRKGIYWLGTREYGLISYDTKDQRFHIYNNVDQQKILASNFIYSLHEDSNGNLWIGTDKGLSLFIRSKEEMYSFVSNVKNRLYDNLILDVFEDNAKNIWIATPEGLNRLKKSRFQYYDFRTDGQVAKVQIDKRIGADKFWYNSGNEASISCFDRKRNKLNKYQLNTNYFSYNQETGLHWFLFNDIYEDSRNNLWLAIDDGLYRFDRLTNKIIDSVEVQKLEIKNISTEEYDISDEEGIPDNILNIQESNKGILYLFTLAGIYKYDIKSKKILQFFSFNIEIEYLYDINYGFIKHVLKDNTGNFWIRTSKGIYFFNTQTNKLILKFKFGEEIIGTSATEGNIIETSDNLIWFAVLPNLYQIDFLIDSIKTIRGGDYVDIGHCNLKEDSDKNLWIYTDNGLCRYDRNKNTFKRFSVDDGLADNQLNGIVDDNRGNIWISSSKGLTRFEKESEIFEVVSSDFDYFTFTGLSEQKRKSNGEVIFYTDKGFYSFYPDSINRHEPQIAITKFILNGEAYKFDSLVYEKTNINLNWDQNFFTFEFAALDFTDPAKNQYAYMLEGLDKDWVYVDAANRKAGYTGISAKDYVFKVKASNNNKIWNEDGISIKISIKPPFWKTPLFYGFVAISLIISVFLIIKWRERNLQREKRILEEKVAERTKEIERQKEEIRTQRDVAERQRDQISEQKQSIMDSIHYAKRIQSAVLPPEDLIKKTLPKHFILYKPRDVVSGDFYWMVTKNNRIIIAAADCTGHGVPGAFMSMLGVAFLNEIVSKKEIIHANQILEELKDHVIKSLHQTGKEGESKDGMDIALSVIDMKEMTLEFAGAYNPLYKIRKNELEQVKADRMPIGIYYVQDKTFTNHKIDLEKGDTIYMFSDGYPDQFNGKTGKKFMAKRFKKLLLGIQDKSMNEQKEILNDTIEEWMKGTEQIDDILVVGIRV